jgi:hypothetical protein
MSGGLFILFEIFWYRGNNFMSNHSLCNHFRLNFNSHNDNPKVLSVNCHFVKFSHEFMVSLFLIYYSICLNSVRWKFSPSMNHLKCSFLFSKSLDFCTNKSHPKPRSWPEREQTPKNYYRCRKMSFWKASTIQIYVIFRIYGFNLII